MENLDFSKYQSIEKLWLFCYKLLILTKWTFSSIQFIWYVRKSSTEIWLIQYTAGCKRVIIDQRLVNRQRRLRNNLWTMLTHLPTLEWFKIETLLSENLRQLYVFHFAMWLCIVLITYSLFLVIFQKVWY